MFGPCTSLLKPFTTENFESLSSPSLSSVAVRISLIWQKHILSLLTCKVHKVTAAERRKHSFGLASVLWAVTRPWNSLGLSHVRHSGPPHADEGAAVTKELKRTEAPFQLMFQCLHQALAAIPLFSTML